MGSVIVDAEQASGDNEVDENEVSCHMIWGISGWI